MDELREQNAYDNAIGSGFIDNGEEHPVVEDEDVSVGDILPKTQKSSVTQWSDVDGKIIAVSNTFERLDKGYYSIHTSNSIGMYFVKEEIELNKLYRLPNEASDLVLNDISKFWTLEDTYKKYNRVFRRNYLLYSAPGTGKTSLINLMCKELIDLYDGIVFSLSSEHEIELLPDAVKRIKKIEPDRKIIAIIEDIDTFTQASSSFNTLLLNILDGNFKLGTVATKLGCLSITEGELHNADFDIDTTINLFKKLMKRVDIKTEL